MQRVTIIALILFYSAGTLLLPMGNFASGVNLHDMYVQCSEEDPDINPADFVFEHLMNLEDLMHYFEGETETEDGERPHESSEHVLSVSLFVAQDIRTINIQKQVYEFITTDKMVYPLVNEDLYPSTYLSNILRPPIV